MKRALVTGGGSPIGRAIARRLAAEGLHVILHAHRNIAGVQAEAHALREAGASAEAVGFDLTNHGICDAAMNALLESGPIQVLVHNAGTHDDAPMAGMSAAQWHGVIDVSLKARAGQVRPGQHLDRQELVCLSMPNRLTRQPISTGHHSHHKQNLEVLRS